MTEIEYRTAVEMWPESDLAVRSTESAPDDPYAGLRFSGYAAVFDTPSEPLPQFRGARETVARTAFTKTLTDRRAPVRLYWNHDVGIPLASTRARGEVGRLTLTQDSIGLRADAVFLPERRA